LKISLKEKENFKVKRMLRNFLKSSSIPLSRHFSGAIRGAGGGMGKRGEVHEEEYFHKQRQEQFKKLKNKQVGEKEFVAERIKQHQEAMEFHKRMIEEYKSGKRLEEVKQDMKKS
jgi:aminopeptidase N